MAPVDKIFRISYYVYMDINMLERNEKMTASVNIVCDDPHMKNYLSAILESDFIISDNDTADIAVVCLQSIPKKVNGPCVYIGKHPNELLECHAFLERPFLISDLVRTCHLIICKERKEAAGFLADHKKKTVFFNDRKVSLTGREYQLFSLLLSKAGECVSREDIEKTLWNGENAGNSPDVYICFLRKKLESIAGKGILISVRGQGYMLKKP